MTERLVFALLAAEQARRQHSLDIAERQYQIASQASAGADAPTRYRIARGLGEVRMRRGNYRAARQTLEAARHLAQGEPPLVTAEIEGVLGELAFKQGDMISAAQAIERGLSQLGFTVPRRWGTYAVLVLWEIGVQTLHTWFPRRLVGRQGLDHAERDLLAVRLYSRLARVFWFSRGTIKKFWTHLRELNLVERYVPTLELAQAYSNHAAAMSLVPWFRRASRYAHHSFQIREQFGDLWGQAQTQHFHGVAMYAASRFGECIEICREAIRLFDRTGDFWELNMARYQLAASFYGLGDLAAASQEAWKMHASGLELGDIQASGLSICLVAKANCGRVPQEIVQAELDRPRGADSQTTSQVWQAEGMRRLAAGDFHAAAEAFQRGWDIARRGGICNTYVVACLPWLAGALRREAARIQPTDAAASRRLIKRARRAVRRGLRLAFRFQNDLPHCLREAGLLAAARGRRRTARAYLQQSLQVANRQGARYEHAQTSLALAELDRQLGQARRGPANRGGRGGHRRHRTRRDGEFLSGLMTRAERGAAWGGCRKPKLSRHRHLSRLRERSRSQPRERARRERGAISPGNSSQPYSLSHCLRARPLPEGEVTPGNRTESETRDAVEGTRRLSVDDLRPGRPGVLRFVPQQAAGGSEVVAGLGQRFAGGKNHRVADLGGGFDRRDKEPARIAVAQVDILAEFVHGQSGRVFPVARAPTQPSHDDTQPVDVSVHLPGDFGHDFGRGVPVPGAVGHVRRDRPRPLVSHHDLPRAGQDHPPHAGLPSALQHVVDPDDVVGHQLAAEIVFVRRRPQVSHRLDAFHGSADGRRIREIADDGIRHTRRGADVESANAMTSREQPSAGRPAHTPGRPCDQNRDGIHHAAPQNIVSAGAG